MGQIDAVGPLKAGAEQFSGFYLRIEDYIEIEGLENPVWRTLRIVTTAFVVEHGNLFSRTLAIAYADLQRVWIGIVVFVKFLNRFSLGEIQAGLFAYDYLVTAAVNRRTRLDADKTVATSLVCVLFDLKTTNYAPPVEPLMMVA